MKYYLYKYIINTNKNSILKTIFEKIYFKNYKIVFKICNKNRSYFLIIEKIK